MQISVKGYYFLFKMVLPPLMLTPSSPLFFFSYPENQPVLRAWNGYSKFGALFEKVIKEKLAQRQDAQAALKLAAMKNSSKTVKIGRDLYPGRKLKGPAS